MSRASATVLAAPTRAGTGEKRLLPFAITDSVVESCRIADLQSAGSGASAAIPHAERNESGDRSFVGAAQIA